MDKDGHGSRQGSRQVGLKEKTREVRREVVEQGLGFNHRI